MSDSVASTDDKLFNRRVIESSIRVALVFLLVLWCFNIVRPFVLLTLWGAILAVAVFPLFEKLQILLGGRQKLAATLMTLIAVAILVIPSVMLSESAIENSQQLAEQMKAGTLRIPPPPDSVREWPLIGKKLHGAWEPGINQPERRTQQLLGSAERTLPSGSCRPRPAPASPSCSSSSPSSSRGCCWSTHKAVLTRSTRYPGD